MTNDCSALVTKCMPSREYGIYPWTTANGQVNGHVIENEYEKLLSGQAVTRKDFWVFVKDTDGVTWLLQKRLGYAELDADLKAYRDELKHLVNKKNYGCDTMNRWSHFAKE